MTIALSQSSGISPCFKHSVNRWASLQCMMSPESFSRSEVLLCYLDLLLYIFLAGESHFGFLKLRLAVHL